jgi:hypothetical protein
VGKRRWVHSSINGIGGTECFYGDEPLKPKIAYAQRVPRTENTLVNSPMAASKKLWHQRHVQHVQSPGKVSVSGVWLQSFGGAALGFCKSMKSVTSP